ncbi:MAG TPA: LolA-related protein [Steroidobacteraceae bacterium]|nr:LolA-related protein [Steroidobacteraceae bacterium]
MSARRHRLVPAALAVLWLAAGAAAGPPLPAATPLAGAHDDFTELLELLAARRHGRVSFTEVHDMAMLERPLRSSGELLYEAPDRLEKRTLEPRPETLILEHGVLTAQRGHRTHVLRLHDYPQLVPFVESIRATLAGDRAALEHYFHVQFSGDLGHWRLELVPVDATVARTVRDIRISGEREAIRSVEIRQGDGDHSLLTIGAEVPP